MARPPEKAENAHFTGRTFVRGAMTLPGRLLREPVLQFLVLGGLLFALHGLLGGRDAEAVRGATPLIHITAADAERMGQFWVRQWRRPPTADELRGLLADHLKEEVLTREARELKLDEDDTIVRRRLAQKMAFLLEETARPEQAPDAELIDLYEARPDLVRTPARVSFVQIFFKGEQGPDRARTVLASLSEASSKPDEKGDRFLLGDAFADEDEASLTNRFGASFARAVLAAEPGRWSGPIASAYGLHLVKITGSTPSHLLPFETVRERLVQEWQFRRQEAAKEQLYAGLLRKYEIVADPGVRALLQPVLEKSGAPR